MLACVSKEDFIDFNLRIIESSMMMMKKNSIAIQNPVSQHVFIIDMEGFTLKVIFFWIFLIIFNCDYLGCQPQSHSGDIAETHTNMPR